MPQIDAAAPFVVLDDASAANAVCRVYSSFIRMDVVPAGAVDRLDACLRQGWKRGWHASVLVPYEFGAPLVRVPSRADRDGALALHDGAMRILWFSSMAQCHAEEVGRWLDEHCKRAGPSGAMHVRSNIDRVAFDAAISRIHRWIEAGHTYQVNFTQRLSFDAFGDPIAFYAGLRAAQPVPYGALIRLPDDTWALSLSPELFVRHDGRGQLVTRPMKGTAPRSGDAGRDAEAAAALAADPKNRAENVMIVDLLRNDVGRIARPGSVAVPQRFEVQPFGRVLQMTSTVTATVVPEVTPAGLMTALFPCGSITGAPKRRTMEIIAELEEGPRGLYTGAIGWIDAPTGKPAAHTQLGPLALSVAIRTLVLGPRRADGVRCGEMGVGGGIVYDSVAEDEYAECGWKARFLTAHDPGFALIETIRVEQGRCLRLEAHLERLRASASAFGFAFDGDAIGAALRLRAASLSWSPARLRVTLDKAGVLTLADGPLQPLQEGAVQLVVAEPALPDADPLRRHKITARASYDAAWQQAEREGAFDALFFNTRGELLEGGRSSVFARIDGQWLTPPVSMDILPGVMRDAVLRDGTAYLGGPAMEGRITRAMLARADAMAVTNALRGVLPAMLKGGA